MRKVQIGINVARFGDQAPDGKSHKFTVYADANNVYEALAAAYYEALDALQAHANLPSSGRRMSSDDKTRKTGGWDGIDYHYREDFANSEDGRLWDIYNERSYPACPLLKREIEVHECYYIQQVRLAIKERDELTPNFNKDKADTLCVSCPYCRKIKTEIKPDDYLKKYDKIDTQTGGE